MHYERFAPSPTGKLHLGHAFSSLLVYNSTKRNNGKFLLRIEDLDYQILPKAHHLRLHKQPE